MNQILHYLNKIETQYDVKIVHAVESGSRLWGFESQDSDYDVRFIYVRPLKWYLSIQSRRDVIEPSLEPPYDINGWDIKKALYLLSKSNPPLLEWLYSPLIYKTTETVQKIKQLVSKHFNPRSTILHYLHMADGNYREYLKREQVILKKYFYVLRPLLACAWIEKHNMIPPAQFSKLLNDFSRNIPKSIIMDLLAQKQNSKELALGKRIDLLNNFIDKEIVYYKKVSKKMVKSPIQMEDLDTLFMEIMMHDD